MGAFAIMVVLGIVIALACIIPLVILKDNGKKVVLKKSNCKQSGLARGLVSRSSSTSDQ